MDYLDRAIDILKREDIIAAPTETVYGLFGDATSDRAIRRIYEVKGRPTCNPLIIHVASIPMASKYCHLSQQDINLIRKFWEIHKLPITFVVCLKENSGISKLVTAGLKTIAIRRPNNDISLKIIEGLQKPLAAPSANTSTTVSPTSAGMVRNDLGDKIPFIIDGGDCKVGVESTILDITQKPYVVLRHGGTPLETISDICNDKIVENKNETCIIAPGMMKKHYAPSIPLRMNAECAQEGEAFIAFGSTAFGYDANLSPKGDLDEAAHNLFSTIKKCDNPEKFKGIAIMPIPDEGIGKAINDRLIRASNGCRNKVLLIILDGFGYSQKIKGNATLEATYIQSLMGRKPRCLLEASGEAVGLPFGQFGNSEVGHLTIGTGRIIKQKLLMITDSIKSGEFDKNPKLIKALENMKTCHIMGLFSDGGVHSHISHFFHCLSLLRNHHIHIKAHIFLDGRDVAQDAGLQTLKDALDQKLIYLNEIATVHGRYYAMDRNNNMDRTKASYNAIKYGQSEYKEITDPIKMIEDFYKKGIYDENIPPFVMDGYGGVEVSDFSWMLNFRTDRIKQILSLIQQDGIKTINIVNVDEKIDRNSIILFEDRKIKNTLGEVISKNGLRQLRIAETEKYAHVTYFMNGGEDIKYDHEDRILVNSPDVADYSITPDMSAAIMTDKLIAAIQSEQYEFILVNYATPDMIGHTGNFESTKSAIRSLDEHIKKVLKVGEAHGYKTIITADHGNAEYMINDDNTACKTHTCSEVPLIYIGPGEIMRAKASLRDVAPTVLKLFNIPKPSEMSGDSII